LNNSLKIITQKEELLLNCSGFILMISDFWFAFLNIWNAQERHHSPIKLYQEIPISAYLQLIKEWLQKWRAY